MIIKTIHNSGTRAERIGGVEYKYNETCFFLSIQDFFKIKHKKEISITKLREWARFDDPTMVPEIDPELNPGLDPKKKYNRVFHFSHNLHNLYYLLFQLKNELGIDFVINVYLTKYSNSGQLIKNFDVVPYFLKYSPSGELIELPNTQDSAEFEYLFLDGDPKVPHQIIPICNIENNHWELICKIDSDLVIDTCLEGKIYVKVLEEIVNELTSPKFMEEIKKVGDIKVNKATIEQIITKINYDPTVTTYINYDPDEQVKLFEEEPAASSTDGLEYFDTSNPNELRILFLLCIEIIENSARSFAARMTLNFLFNQYLSKLGFTLPVSVSEIESYLIGGSLRGGKDKYYKKYLKYKNKYIALKKMHNIT
jgi:hypothetical protein